LQILRTIQTLKNGKTMPITQFKSTLIWEDMVSISTHPTSISKTGLLWKTGTITMITRHQILRNIIDSAHDYGRSSYSKEIAFLSEHNGFGYKGSVFSNNIHADIGLWDYEDTESKIGAYGLPLAIINKDIPSLDEWMTGIDNVQFTCLFS
jgi:hypothetical protein